MKRSTYEHILFNLPLLKVDYEKGIIKNRKTTYDTHGYVSVGLNYKTISIHKIIAVMKYDDEVIDHHINHIDGDKTNNRPENLEVCTASENQKHAYELGLRKPIKGQYHPNTKLIESEVMEIYRLTKVTKMTNREIGDIFGVSLGVVSSIRTKRSWSNVTDRYDEGV